MVNLDSRQQLLGVTVFQDTDQPTKFFYLPGPPHISIEHGEALFDLLTYRKGGAAATDLAGGFLNMTVDVGIGALRDQIESKLKEQYGDETTLAPVPFTKGTAHVVALGEDSQAVHGQAAGATAPSGGPLVAPGPRFIQNILGSGKPALDGDNRATFSFSLSEDGAAFFLGLLSGNVRARPVGVFYDLTYVGLLPAYDLEISIDFKSCYDYLRTRFTLGTLLFKADVDNVVEDLKRQEAIKIREVSRTLELSKPEAIRERQNRIDQLVKQLASGSLFQPALTPGQPKVQGDVITAADPTATVSATLNARPGESRPMAALRERGPTAAAVQGQAEAHGHAANPAGLGASDPGVAASGGGAQPAGGGAQPAGGGAQPAGGGAQPAGGGAQPVGGGAQPARESTQPSGESSQTAGDLWNQLGRPQAAFAVKEIRQEEQLTVTYSLTQVTALEQTVAPNSSVLMLATPQDLAQHVHLVDLNNQFFQRININVTARDVDFAAEGISQMTIQLRYGTRPDGTAPKDTAEVILRSRDDSKDFTFFADGKQTQSYEYKLILDYQHNFGIGVRDDRIEGPWTRTEARSLAVHPSWLGRTLPVMVQLSPNLPPDISEAQARVRYANAARGIDDSTLIRLNAQTRAQLVPVRIVDPSDRFEVTTTLFYSDGTNEALPVIRLPDASSGASDNAVVISAPRANRLDGDIIMQDPLGELETVLVDTQVEQDHVLLDSHTHEMTKPSQREVFAVRLPKRDVAPVLRYRERRLFRDGGLEEDDWREALSPNLVVGIPAAAAMSLGVSYVGPALSVLGLSALELDLSYTDPNGNAKFAQSTTLLITDDAVTHNQDWKIRLPDRQARTYQWKLTLFHADGTQTSSDDTPETRDRLILRVPRL